MEHTPWCEALCTLYPILKYKTLFNSIFTLVNINQYTELYVSQNCVTHRIAHGFVISPELYLL